MLGYTGMLFCAIVFVTVDFIRADFASKPVIIIHGILDSAVDLTDLKSNILRVCVIVYVQVPCIENTSNTAPLMMI